MSSPAGKGMKNKYFIVEYGQTFKHLLEETFKIQRIKFISYDASKHYVVFGANIGSLYIYHLENITKCIKVLPNSFVQPVSLISISPNESNILFVDETGLIVIFEKCFSEKPYNTHIFNEQKGKKITAVQWEGNDKAYVGNSEGTIAVVSIKSKSILSLLHTPYVSLMDLNSRIIQIDVLPPLLLVTTEKKTYICHTDQERYKQVGTQDTARGFGACFLCNTKGVTLYCSRPGLRLWQANVGGDVFSTQKYKGVNPIVNEILRFGKGSVLNVEKTRAPNKEKANFGKVQLFADKFLCILNPENIYIVDPEEKKIIFHYYSEQSIDVRLIGQKILIKFSSGKFLILNFYKFEELMNEIYFKKQFSEGIQLLLRYREYTLDWLKYSPNVKLITNLEFKLSDIDNEIAKQFIVMLDEFRECEKERLKQYLQEDDPKIKNIMHEEPKVEQIKEQLSDELELMCKKYDLFKTCNIIYMPQFSEMLLNLDEDEMAKLFFDFIEYKKSKVGDVEMCWCYKEYIHHFDLKKGHKKLLHLKQETIDFLKESYLNVEAGIDIESCSNSSCIYPLPSSKRGLPKYDKIGKALAKYCEDDALFLRKPYVWFHRLNKITTKKCLKSFLPVILQFGYISILQKFKEHITYNLCHDLVRFFIELRKGKCLNCGTPFSEECLRYIPEWDSIGLALIPFIGSDNVLRIFSDFQQHIPKINSLSEKFYLTCVFSEINSQKHSAENSIEMALNFLSNTKTQSEFKGCLSTFLMGKVDNKIHTNENTITKKELTCSTCSHCKNILHHPVFKHVIQLECGHAFHAICLQLDDNICIICTPNQ